jgi:hypothetical protein
MSDADHRRAFESGVSQHCRAQLRCRGAEGHESFVDEAAKRPATQSLLAQLRQIRFQRCTVAKCVGREIAVLDDRHKRNGLGKQPTDVVLDRDFDVGGSAFAQLGRRDRVEQTSYADVGNGVVFGGAAQSSMLATLRVAKDCCSCIATVPPRLPPDQMRGSI